MASICAVFLLAFTASAYRKPQGAPSTQEIHPDHATMAALSVEKYASDCWKKRPVLGLHQLAAHGQQKGPGAGMEPQGIVPFVTVLKDGFLRVACVKDYLLSFGDKFGDGKFSYSVGEETNVSIVHYTSIVSKEDRKPMTPEVCFNFCRTVPDMLTFGIHNGRDCYCAPFYKSMESDSTQCDAVCDGDTTQFCGGKVKSTIFSMHMCDNTMAKLDDAKKTGTSIASALIGLAQHVRTLSSDMQATAETLQGVFGQVGDPAASNLMQTAKVYAGGLEQASGEGEELAGSLNAAVASAGGNGTFQEVSGSESLTKEIESLTKHAEATMESLEDLAQEASPSGLASAVNASAQYYPLMYFVDKDFTDVPTTCSGEYVAKPMTAVSLDECAYACDSHIKSCVGFSYYNASSAPLCFLFSKFVDSMYYTGCTGTPTGPMPSCMAKLSKFDGTVIKPDPSGKCSGCLKTASLSNRCP